ncbi:MAG: PqqD family protein [Deltaproteobacteria bacterium]|nr:PqqD family protein [Deltaproteobacteria bacterium]
MIKFEDTVFYKPEVISANLDEDLALMNIQTGKYYGLNKVARRIFEKIEKPILVQRLCDELVQEFEVSLERCQAEVLTFLNHLNEQGLLVKHTGFSSSLEARL